MSRLMLCFALLAAGLTAEKTAAKVSAFDKPTFEAYVRHLKVWGPQIKAGHRRSQTVGYAGIPRWSNVHASAGNASADFQYYVSKDGQKVVEGDSLRYLAEPLQAQAR
jgi:hypothetical protein